MSELHVSEQMLDEKIESFQKQFGIVDENAIADVDDFETSYELPLEDGNGADAVYAVIG